MLYPCFKTRRMTNYGFTGTRKYVSDKIILELLASLNLSEKDMIITGGCIGLDSSLSHLTKVHYPLVKQIIVMPTNKSQVDLSVINNGEVIKIPAGLSYRDRNEKIVELSEKVIAFWTGQKTYSGTYMTINIAKKEGKLFKIVEV